MTEGRLPKPPAVMPMQAQRAIDLYDLMFVGTTRDQRDAADRLKGILSRLSVSELAAYYGELMRRRAAEVVKEEDGE